MLYALDERSLYRLNPVAGDVWRALDRERELADLAAAVTLPEPDRAGVDHASLIAVLDELAEWGLIEFGDPVAT